MERKCKGLISRKELIIKLCYLKTALIEFAIGVSRTVRTDCGRRGTAWSNIDLRKLIDKREVGRS